MAEYDDNEDAEGTIKRFKKFAAESSRKYSDIIRRMRYQRAFLSGSQWDGTDESNRGGKWRATPIYNILPMWRNAILNPLLAKPYSIEYSSKDPSADEQAKRLNVWVKSLSQDDNFGMTFSMAGGDQIGVGYGYGYLTTLLDEDTGAPKVELLPIADSTMVIPDPNSVELDGSDMERCAICEFISKRRAKQEYGDVMDDYSEQPELSGFGDSWNPPEGCIALVTFFERDCKEVETVDPVTLARGTKKVWSVAMTKMVGDKIVQQAVLPTKYIPVFPFKGVQVWDKDNQSSYVGIVDTLHDNQKAVNYAGGQLLERLARAPKPLYFAAKEAISGNESDYQNIDKSLSSLVRYNSYTSDGKEIQIPTRIDNTVQYDDLTGIMKAELDLMSTEIGLPLTGIVEGQGQNETTESILLRTKNSESNVSHFATHMRMTVKHIGRVLLDFYAMICGDPMFHKEAFAVNIQDGPEQATTKLDARKKLVALSQLFPDEMKPVVAYNIAKTDDNPEMNAMSSMLAKLLPPAVFSDDIPQVKQLQQQLQQSQAESAQQLQQKDKQIMSMQAQINQLMLRANTDMQIAQMNNATKEKIAVINAQASGQQAQIDLQKSYQESQIRQNEAQMDAAKKVQEIRMKGAELGQKLEFQRRKNELDIERARSAGANAGKSRDEG